MHESSTLTGQWLTESNPEAFEDAVAALLATYRDVFAGESVVVIPDVHYPFHPSTGLVANPDVVAAAVAELGAIAGTDVVVGCRSGPMLSTDATVRTLGYRRLDAEVVDLEEAETEPHQVGLHDGSMEVELPRLLDGATVVVIPTLRTDPETGLALGMPTLARAVLPGATTAGEIWAAVTHCSHGVTLVDGSYTYLGQPRASGFLLSGADLIAVDAAVAQAVGQNPTYLDGRAVRNMGATTAVEGMALEEVAAELPAEPSRRTGEPSRSMGTAYRWYARIVGDAVPPQFLP